MNNQKKGRDLEHRMAEYLSKLGFWVHFMNPAPDGSQPFDLIALNGDETSISILAIDCKTLEGRRFPLDRVEDNQRLAFEALNRRSINSTYFAVEMEYNKVCLIPSQSVIQAIDEGLKSIPVEDYTYAHLCLE